MDGTGGFSASNRLRTNPPRCSDCRLGMVYKGMKMCGRNFLILYYDSRCCTVSRYRGPYHDTVSRYRITIPYHDTLSRYLIMIPYRIAIPCCIVSRHYAVLYIMLLYHYISYLAIKYSANIWVYLGIFGEHSGRFRGCPHHSAIFVNIARIEPNIAEYSGFVCP